MDFWQVASDIARTLINLEVAWVAIQLLPMTARNRRILYLVALLNAPVGWVVNLLGLTALKPVAFVLFYALPPFLLWRASRGERAACAVLVLLIVIGCEVLAVLALSLMGVSAYDIGCEAPATMFAVRLVYMALMAVLARLAARLVARVRSDEGEGPLGWYGLFFGAQIATMIALWFTAFFDETIEPNALLGFVVLGALCFAADAVAIVSLERHGAALRERQRSELLEAQLTDYLAESHDALTSAADAARFRHDWRNHLQVVGELVSAGEGEKARAYVGELRGLLVATQAKGAGEGASDKPAAAVSASASRAAADPSTPHPARPTAPAKVAPTNAGDRP